MPHIIKQNIYIPNLSCSNHMANQLFSCSRQLCHEVAVKVAHTVCYRMPECRCRSIRGLPYQLCHDGMFLKSNMPQNITEIICCFHLFVLLLSQQK